MLFTERTPEVEATEMLFSACDWEVKPKKRASLTEMLRYLRNCPALLSGTEGGAIVEGPEQYYSGVLGRQSQ